MRADWTHANLQRGEGVAFQRSIAESCRPRDLLRYPLTTRQSPNAFVPCSVWKETAAKAEARCEQGPRSNSGMLLRRAYLVALIERSADDLSAQRARAAHHQH